MTNKELKYADTSKDCTRITIRMPTALLNAVGRASTKNHRNKSQEISFRVTRTFLQEGE